MVFNNVRLGTFLIKVRNCHFMFQTCNDLLHNYRLNLILSFSLTYSFEKEIWDLTMFPVSEVVDSAFLWLHCSCDNWISSSSFFFPFPTENMALPLNKRLVVVKPGDMQINIFLQWMMTSWVLEVEQKDFFFFCKREVGWKSAKYASL